MGLEQGEASNECGVVDGYTFFSKSKVTAMKIVAPLNPFYETFHTVLSILLPLAAWKHVKRKQSDSKEN